jgi:hypothetical protein
VSPLKNWGGGGAEWKCEPQTTSNITHEIPRNFSSSISHIYKSRTKCAILRNIVPEKKSYLFEAKLFLKYLPSDFMFFLTITIILQGAYFTKQAASSMI